MRDGPEYAPQIDPVQEKAGDERVPPPCLAFRPRRSGCKRGGPEKERRDAKADRQEGQRIGVWGDKPGDNEAR